MVADRLTGHWPYAAAMTNNKQLILLAAVEISGGAAVVRKGAGIDSKHTFGDPVADANAWIGQGAQWLHVVDLDAMAGTGDNHRLVADVVRAARGRAHTQVAGGIIDDDSLLRAMKTGCERIVLDTAAMSEWEWVCAQLPTHNGRIGMAIDVSGGAIWAPGSSVHGSPLMGTLASLQAAKCPRYVVTDIDHEGGRKGPDIEMIREICSAVRGKVDAAGGIGTLEQLHALLEMTPHGVEGAVLDAALYKDYFNVAEAIAAVEPRFDPYQWGPAQPWGLTQGLY